MRARLWPDMAAAGHEAELAAQGDGTGTGQAAFVALDDRGVVTGFVEAALRHDYVNGCDTTPVAFVEGVYVAPAARGRGIGRRLVGAVADWGRAAGCTELASDAGLADRNSHAFHRAAGFAETERVVFFRRAIGPA